MQYTVITLCINQFLQVFNGCICLVCAGFKERSVIIMRGLMVFDNLNDVVFMKCDTKFCEHIQKIGISQDLVKPKEVDLILVFFLAVIWTEFKFTLYT